MPAKANAQISQSSSERLKVTILELEKILDLSNGKQGAYSEAWTTSDNLNNDNKSIDLETNQIKILPLMLFLEQQRYL